MMDTSHYTCIQTHRMYKLKSESQCEQWTLDNYNMSAATNV